MSNIIIFGYGSLINLESLRSTAPNAKDIQPAYIKGFKRDFSLWDAEGWTESNLDVAGKGMCAVDVKVSPDPNMKVNGVIFTVGKEDHKRLIKRESNYKLIKTMAYHFENDKEIGECFLFWANKNNGTYDFKSAAQKRYLEICLESARQYGDRYYEDFIGSTFIGNRRLNDFPELLVF